MINSPDQVRTPTPHEQSSSHDGDGLHSLLLTVLLVSPLALLAIVMNWGNVLSDALFRIVLCVYFVFWGIAYYEMGETSLRLYIGLGEVLGGVWSIWYQLGQFGTANAHVTSSDRLIFIGGSIALLANGVKDADKGLKKMRRKRHYP